MPAKTRSISAENYTGEKGKAGMATAGTGANAARDLGQGWKVSPSVVVPAHGQVKVYVGPLDPGRYRFFNDFYQAAEGWVVVAAPGK